MGLLDGALDNDMTRFGLGLLAASGNNANLGQNLMAAVGSVDQFRKQKAEMERAKQMQEFQAFQMEQAKAQMARQSVENTRTDQLRALPQQFSQPAIPMSADGFGPSEPAQFDREGYAKALEGIDPVAGLQYQESIKKSKPALINVAEGGSLFDPTTMTSVFNSPKTPKDNEFVALLKASGIDPASPQGRQLLQKRLQKEATHQAPVSVSYGAPVAGKDALGNDVFFQPGKDGRDPSIVQGVTPPSKPMPVEFNKSVVGLNELTNALNTYKTELKASGGPAAFATGETKGKLQGAYTALQMGLKNAFELGALAGPDLELLQGMLVDPTSAKSMLYGGKGVDAQISQAEKYIKNRGSAVYKAHKQPVPKEFEIGAKSFTDFGYKSPEDAIRDGQNAIMRNPAAKAEVVKRLKDMGIDTGSM